MTDQKIIQANNSRNESMEKENGNANIETSSSPLEKDAGIGADTAMNIGIDSADTSETADPTTALSAIKRNTAKRPRTYGRSTLEDLNLKENNNNENENDNDSNMSSSRPDSDIDRNTENKETESDDLINNNSNDYNDANEVDSDDDSDDSVATVEHPMVDISEDADAGVDVEADTNVDTNMDNGDDSQRRADFFNMDDLHDQHGPYESHDDEDNDTEAGVEAKSEADANAGDTEGTTQKEKVVNVQDDAEEEKVAEEEEEEEEEEDQIVEDFTQNFDDEEQQQEENIDAADSNTNDGTDPDANVDVANKNDNDNASGSDSSTKPATATATATAPTPMKVKVKVTDQEILETVDALFSEADVESITIKDITSSLEGMFEMKLKKAKRKLVKERLIFLVNQKLEEDEDEDNSDDHLDDAEENDDDQSTFSSNESESEAEDDADADANGRPSAKRKNKRAKAKTSLSQSRTKRQPKQRKPSHLKIHHEMKRKKQIQEMQVREEELKMKTQEKLTEKDRARAEAIAKKLETDSEEQRLRRVEDRMGLLQKLERKRLQLLNVPIDVDSGLGLTSKGETQRNDDGNDNDDNEKGVEVEVTVHESLDVKMEKEANDKTLEIDTVNEDDTGSDENNENDEGGADSGSDIESDSDSDSDEELEIVRPDVPKQTKLNLSPSSKFVKTENAKKVVNHQAHTARKASPKSVLDFFSTKATSSANDQRGGATKAKTKVYSNPRAMLRNALKAKQVEHGNKWLARELGYNTVEEHIRDCTISESKKKRQIIEKEQDRLLRSQKRNAQVTDIIKEELIGIERQDGEDARSSIEYSGPKENTSDEAKRTRVNLNEDSEPEEEEDEEMALAREIGEQKLKDIQEGNADEDILVNDNTQMLIPDESFVGCDHGSLHTQQDAIKNKESPHESIVEDLTQVEPQSMDHLNDSIDESIDLNASSSTNTVDINDKEERSTSQSKEEGSEDTSAEQEFEPHNESPNFNLDNNEVEAKKKPKNLAWKAMLQKEKELLKKQKRNRAGTEFLDAEAEEEEEEEGVAGLEDFGFTLQANKKGDGDDDEIDEEEGDELEDIVDDLSDNEGDEEAGEAARKSMAMKEEKLKHKEIMRRMREGYDGKRGGIAGGSGARGNLRFDQLVAADNKDDAKRLGLLNDDELDSDNEDVNDTKDEGEIEDESALLDKMLKDRYLQRTNIPEENFTDSEGEDDEDEAEEGQANKDDNEDKDQEALAKRFARRARMNRLLEEYGEDEEFSQRRLLDQDEELQKELKSIRTVHSKTKRYSSFSSLSTTSNTRSNSNQETLNESGGSQGSSSLLTSTASLSMLKKRSKLSRKRKFSFLPSAGANSMQRKSSVKTSNISRGHVLFSGETSHSSSLSRSASLPTGNKAPLRTISKKRKPSTSQPSSNSLWSKVSSGNFMKKRRFVGATTSQF